MLIAQWGRKRSCLAHLPYELLSLRTEKKQGQKWSFQCYSVSPTTLRIADCWWRCLWLATLPTKTTPYYQASDLFYFPSLQQGCWGRSALLNPSKNSTQRMVLAGSGPHLFCLRGKKPQSNAKEQQALGTLGQARGLCYLGLGLIKLAKGRKSDEQKFFSRKGEQPLLRLRSCREQLTPKTKQYLLSN